MRRLPEYHPGQKGWQFASTTKGASVSFEKSASIYMKTKSVEAEMNALTLAAERGTPKTVDSLDSLDIASLMSPVPTATWMIEM